MTTATRITIRFDGSKKNEASVGDVRIEPVKFECQHVNGYVTNHGTTEPSTTLSFQYHGGCRTTA